MVDGENVAVARRRETIDDLLALENENVITIDIDILN